MNTFSTHSADETTALGRRLSAELKPGSIVLLRGDLGAGKTTMVKGIAEGFHAARRRRHQPDLYAYPRISRPRGYALPY